MDDTPLEDGKLFMDTVGSSLPEKRTVSSPWARMWPPEQLSFYQLIWGKSKFQWTNEDVAEAEGVKVKKKIQVRVKLLFFGNNL